MANVNSQTRGKKPQPVRKPTKGEWLFNIGAIIVMVVAAVMFTIVMLRFYTRHGNEINVPNLKGLSIAQAMDKLDEAGLDAEVNDSVYIKHITPNTVFNQSIAPGSLVKKGRVIYLTVNTAQPPMVALPDIADNCSVREAAMKLTILGLQLAPQETIKGEKDWVYAVKIDGKNVVAGQRVPSDARITLVVGDGNYFDEDVDEMRAMENDSADFSGEEEEN